MGLWGRRAAALARHRGAVGPTNMSAALPRSRATAGPWATAGIEADEHVRRAAEVERHRGAPRPPTAATSRSTARGVRGDAEWQATWLRVRPPSVRGQVGVDGPILLDHWYPGVGPSETLGIVRDSYDRIFPAGYITVSGKTRARITLIHG